MLRKIPQKPTLAGKRKRTRKPHQATEGKLWPFLDALPDAVLVVNRDGRVLYFNAVGEAMFGYNRHELLDHPVETLLPERFRNLHSAHLHSYFKNPQPRSMGTGLDLFGRRRDGSEFPVDISLSPMKWRRRAVAVATVREMTDRLRKHAQLLDLANDAIIVLDMSGTIDYWNQGAERLYGWTWQEALGKTMPALLKTAFPVPPEEILDLLLRDGHWEGELVQTCRDGLQITVSSHCTLQRRGGKPTGILDISSDITERKRAEASVRSLLQISELLYSTLDIDAQMDALVVEGMKLADAQAGFAGLRTPAGMVCQKYFRGSEIIPFEYCWPPGDGLPGWVMIHKVPYVTNDAQNDGRISPDLVATFRWNSAISTPVLDRHAEVIGFFEFFNKMHDGFTKTDEEKLLAVARTASAAIENALAYRKIQNAESEVRQLTARVMHVQDEERRNLARTLHETTAQGLVSLKMNLELLTKAPVTPDMNTQRILSDSLSLAEQCTEEVRTLSYLLHPPLLDEMGLVSALRWFTSGFTQRSGIRVKLEAPDLERLPQELETMLFRIVQECLTNIHRHSGSPTATIRIDSGITGLSLEVEDAGRGMPSEVLKNVERGVFSGVGIAGMQERLKHFGGRLEIHSSSSGTTVKASLPLRTTTS